MPEMTLVAAGLDFPEGPVVLADGSVLVVEIRRGTLSRVLPNGAIKVVADLGGGPNGAAIGPDGSVYICNNGGRFTWREAGGLTRPGPTPPEHQGGSIQKVDLADGAFVTLYEGCEGRRLLAPNDLVFDRDGGFWFTDYGTSNTEGSRFGALLYARADGSFIRIAGRLPSPNGIGLSPDGKTLYAADTQTGRLWGCDIIGPGELGPGVMPGLPGRVVASLPGYQLMDSLAVEADGRVCVATLINGGITICTPEGGMEHVPVGDPMVTNIAFGGPDMCGAWITASATGKLYRTRWPRPGLTLAYAA